MMDELLQKVKENLILEHDADDKLLERFITAAISYAESYQHIAAGYYQVNKGVHLSKGHTHTFHSRSSRRSRFTVLHTC